MNSPTVRVRPFKFKFENFNLYSVPTHTVSYYWDKEKEDKNHLEVFPRGGDFSSTKIITLYRKGDFQVEARYSNKSEVPAGTEPLITKWLIKGITDYY